MLVLTSTLLCQHNFDAFSRLCIELEHFINMREYGIDTETHLYCKNNININNLINFFAKFPPRDNKHFNMYSIQYRSCAMYLNY